MDSIIRESTRILVAKTHYDTLDICHDATHDDIIQAYQKSRSFLISNKSDALRAGKALRKLDAARKVLIDPRFRYDYNKHLRMATEKQREKEKKKAEMKLQTEKDQAERDRIREEMIQIERQQLQFVIDNRIMEEEDISETGHYDLYLPKIEEEPAECESMASMEPLAQKSNIKLELPRTPYQSQSMRTLSDCRSTETISTNSYPLHGSGENIPTLPNILLSLPASELPSFEEQCVPTRLEPNKPLTYEPTNSDHYLFHGLHPPEVSPSYHTLSSISVFSAQRSRSCGTVSSRSDGQFYIEESSHTDESIDSNVPSCSWQQPTKRRSARSRVRSATPMELQKLQKTQQQLRRLPYHHMNRVMYMPGKRSDSDSSSKYQLCVKSSKSWDSDSMSTMTPTTTPSRDRTDPTTTTSTSKTTTDQVDPQRTIVPLNGVWITAVFLITAATLIAESLRVMFS